LAPTAKLGGRLQRRSILIFCRMTGTGCNILNRRQVQPQCGTDACGFEYWDAKDRYVLTSLRHTLATLRLRIRTGIRTSVKALSKQMGTSERMIERHYGHDQILGYRDESLS